MTQAHRASPEIYQIRVRGRLDTHWSDWLGGLAVTYDDADGCDTILYGPVGDQAALHGLLIKIRDLGVPLLAVQRIAPDHGPGPASRAGVSPRQTKSKALETQRKGRTV